ncbi:MAG: hypothetical protein EG824_11345 [Deltaproteobacteria bacterium]|nr:hypothetical protein [Deltaproteobacteria bacterium]
MVRKLLGMLLCVSILLLAVVPAVGSPGRMVQVNGKIHRLLRNSEYSDNRIKYSRGQPDDHWKLVTEAITLPALTTPWPCDRNIPVYGTHSNALESFAAEGLAVFNNKIWVAYTADADCNNPSAGMAAYVSAFDLTPTADAPDGHWTLFPDERGPDYPPVQYNKIAIGSVHTDTPAKGWGSGAAITVFNTELNKQVNQLYLFTDNGIYTSGDGITWTYRSRPFHINALREAQHEPLDAVTINTPDGQRILIVYGYLSGQHYYYDHLDAVDWNGQFGSASQARIYNCANGCEYDANDSGLYDPSGHWKARVSLSVGTKAKGNAGDDQDLAAGALKPAVQLFGQSGESFTTSDHNPARHAEYVYTTIANGWGTWTWDSTRVKYFNHENPSLMVYPWSEFMCNATYPGRQSLRQSIVLLGGYNWWLTETPFRFVSDSLIPRYQDSNPACTFKDAEGNTHAMPPPAGKVNITADIKRDYWTLVGVVLGGPPFSSNATTNTNILDKLSKVSISQDLTKTVETTTEMENTLSVSVGHTLTAGLFDMFTVSKSFDASYKHTWQKESGTKSSVKMSLNHAYGSGTATEAAIGTVGWLIFSAPHVYVQDFTVYAYDYRHDSSSGGTALTFPDGSNLDLQTVSTKPDEPPDYVDEYFDLRNPEASGEDFAGMGWFNYGDVYNNTDARDWWHAPIDRRTGEPLDWQNDERWETRAGDGSPTYYHCTSGDNSCNAITPILASSGSEDTRSYELVKETMTGSGHTNEIELNRGKSVGGELSLDGFKVGGENSINVGYDGKFSWNTKTTTGTGTAIGLGQLVPACALTQTDCYKWVRVRPYWLNAVPSFAAAGRIPWIPSAFKNQSPWCLTWKITTTCKVGEQNCPLSASAGNVALSPLSASDGGIGGTAPPPVNAFGRVVNGNGGDDGGAPYSHYVIQGGRMAWVDDDGGEHRIPMTADDFVPSIGATIEVAGGTWSASGNAWKRHGDSWMFQTNPGAQPRVTLNLDFGSATYDLTIQNADLNGRMLAGVTKARLVLGVNQRYKFFTILNHDIDISWQWSKPPADNATTHVTSFEGRYDSTNQSGKMEIAGTLPADLPAFGDMEINVNDHPYVVRLITMDGFQGAFETGSVFKYAKEGLILDIDFGKKTWSATFNEKAFHSLLAPRWGTVRARIIVGGVPWMTEDNAIVDYSANLKLRQ